MQACSPRITRKALQATQQHEHASTRRSLSIEAMDLHSPAFVDGRAQALTQRKFQAMAEQQPPSPLQRMVEQSPQQLTQRRQLQRFSASPQQGRLSISETALQRQHKLNSDENRTGMPDTLKAGLERLSGMDLSQVRVHANSPRPAQLNALAYAQGNDIQLGPGQGHYLSHEAWHVVQQRQGRVKPTMQVKGESVNDDAGLEHEADVMGAKAMQMRRSDQTASGLHAEALARAHCRGGASSLSVRSSAEGPSLNPVARTIRETRQNMADGALQRRFDNFRPSVSQSSAAIIQRKAAPGILNRTTHLIEMKGGSLLNGEEGDRVYPNDVLVLEDSDRVWSRRGVDGERRRAFHRDESTTDYKYFRVLKHNNTDLSGELHYVRYTTFDFTVREGLEGSVAEAENNNVLREMLRDTDELLSSNIALARQTNRLLARFADIIDSAPEKSSINKESFYAGFDAATNEIESKHIAKAIACKYEARAERYKANPKPENVSAIHNKAMLNRKHILGALANIELNAVGLGRGAMQDKVEGTDEEDAGIGLWREVLNIGDAAYDLRTEGTAEALQRISALTASAKEKFNSLYGYFGNAWDGFGVVAASVEAMAAITALSAVIATVGMAIGIIAAELGVGFAIISHQREKALAKTQAMLEQREFNEDLVHIAEYAKKQKRKKKKRQLVVAGGGLAVAVLAGVGLVGGPVAIVMAVLGAAVGIGFILYKWYRKKKGKKKAMRALINGAVVERDPESISALNKLGIADEEIDSAVGDHALCNMLAKKVEQKLKDRRVDTANRLVGYVTLGKPSEKVGAEAILINLGIDPAKVRERYSHDKSVSQVASKLSSW